jgi:hypothetical protein
VNDLTFASNGDLYFTDQGQTGMHDSTGCVYRLRANGQVDRVLDNVPSPNGLVLNAHENVLAFTQEMGISLAGLGKFDDPLGDESEIVCKPKGYARHFERDTQNPLGFGIDIEAV